MVFRINEAATVLVRDEIARSRTGEIQIEGLVKVLSDMYPELAPSDIAAHLVNIVEDQGGRVETRPSYRS